MTKNSYGFGGRGFTIAGMNRLLLIALVLGVSVISLGQPAAAPKDFGPIAVDATSRGEAMSPLIYSQFIEHLGRCIYGGIWAEMLEDRKFYYPITLEYKPYTKLVDTAFPVVGASPWEIVAPAAGDAVAMSADKPFVGKHTPLLKAGAGIRQNDLGVLKDKKYTGYVWLKAPAGAGSATIVLAWGAAVGDRQSVEIKEIGGEYKKYAFEFTAGAATDKAQLSIAAGSSPLLIGTISLMPADHVDGMRADTLALLKELKAPIYRWPGGNFVSGYDWRDGIGDRDRRPPRTNPAWTGVEHNDFGMHEFIRFCKHLDTEPWITVNTGFGDAYSAAAELEYANGPADSYYGAKRAANGSAQAFAVKYWGIGNEMWGAWQLGYMKREHYEIKQNWVVDKMREVDPKIIPIASGSAGPWSLGLLKNCSDHMALIAEHFYTKEKPDILAHIRQMNDNIKKKAEFHRQARKDLPNLAGKDIKIAMTEWNYWYGPTPYGELGTRYYLKDALGIAAGLNEYARQSDIIAAAFYAQTVNVIGCIKTTKTAAAFDSTGLVLKLYRKEFGTIPVKTTASDQLDVQAMLSADGRTLTIAIVNPWRQALDLPLELKGAKPSADNWKSWQITGEGLQSTNAPGEAPKVRLEELPVKAAASLHVSGESITLVRIPVE